MYTFLILALRVRVGKKDLYRFFFPGTFERARVRMHRKMDLQPPGYLSRLLSLDFFRSVAGAHPVCVRERGSEMNLAIEQSRLAAYGGPGQVGAQPFHGSVPASLHSPNVISFPPDAVRAALGLQINDIPKGTGSRHFTQPINAFDPSRTITIPYYSRAFATNILQAPASILINVLSPLVFTTVENARVQTYSVVKHLLPWQSVAPYGTTATMTKSFVSQDVGMENVSRSYTCDLRLMTNPEYALGVRIEAAEMLGESCRLSLYRYVSARLVEYGLMERMGAGMNARNTGQYNQINPAFGLYGTRFAVGSIAEPAELIEFIEQVSTLIPPQLLSQGRLHVMLPRGAFARLRMGTNFKTAKDIVGRMMFSKPDNTYVVSENQKVLEAEEMFSPVSRHNNVYAELPDMRLQPDEDLFNPLAMETAFAQYYYLPTFSDTARTNGGSFPCNPPIALYDATQDDHRVVRIGDAIRFSGIFNMGHDPVDQIEQAGAFSHKYKEVAETYFTDERHAGILKAREIARTHNHLPKIQLGKRGDRAGHLPPFLALADGPIPSIEPTRYIGDMEPSNLTGYWLDFAGKSLTAALGRDNRHAGTINSIFNVLRKVESQPLTEDGLRKWITENTRNWYSADGLVAEDFSKHIPVASGDGTYAGLGSYRGLTAIANTITSATAGLSHLATEANAALGEFDAFVDDVAEIFKCNALMESDNTEDGKGRHAALFQNVIVDRPYAWVLVSDKPSDEQPGIPEGEEVQAAEAVDKRREMLETLAAAYDTTYWKMNTAYAKEVDSYFISGGVGAPNGLPKTGKPDEIVSLILGLADTGATYKVSSDIISTIAGASRVRELIVKNVQDEDVKQIIEKAVAVALLSKIGAVDPAERVARLKAELERPDTLAMLMSIAKTLIRHKEYIAVYLGNRHEGEVQTTEGPSGARPVPTNAGSSVYVRVPLRITSVIFAQIYESKLFKGLILASDPNANYTRPLFVEDFAAHGYGGSKRWREHPDFMPLKTFTTRQIIKSIMPMLSMAHNEHAGISRREGPARAGFAPSGAAGNVLRLGAQAGGAFIPNAPVIHRSPDKYIAEHMDKFRTNWEYKLKDVMERSKMTVTLQAVLELLYLFECVSATSFRAFEEKGVLIPADMLLLRANIRFQTEGILLVATGSFITLVTPPWVRAVVSSEHGIVRLDGSHSRGVAQVEPGGGYTIPHVWLNRYRGGLSVEPVDLGDSDQIDEWIDTTDPVSRGDISPDSIRSLMCLLVPLTEIIDPQAIGVTTDTPPATSLVFSKRTMPNLDEKLYSSCALCSASEYLPKLLGHHFQQQVYRGIIDCQNVNNFKRNLVTRPFVAYKGPFKDAERNQIMQGVGPLGLYELQASGCRAVYDASGLRPNFVKLDPYQRMHK